MTSSNDAGRTHAAHPQMTPGISRQMNTIVWKETPQAYNNLSSLGLIVAPLCLYIVFTV